jgi:ADP-ribose pyrophosphatase YjhB (NUDIX family)
MAGIMVAVGAIIEDKKGRILLVNHVSARGGFWQGKWICPGGKLEEGETIEEGIKREIKEETSLDIELTRPLVPFDRVVKENKKVMLHVIYIDYMARLVAGELRPGSDVGEGRWVERKSLSQLELHEDTKRLLEIAGIM